jgi:hypothetical protein
MAEVIGEYMGDGREIDDRNGDDSEKQDDGERRT